MHELDERSDSFELMPVPTEFADMAITRKQMEATTSFDETTSESNEGLNEDDEYELNDPNLNESSRRKVRHNLTERRRVDRMNQLFKKLFEALEDSDPAGLTSTPNKYAELLNVCGADGKPINPNKWSKADVLEGALNVIQDLRKHGVKLCFDDRRLSRVMSCSPSASARHGAAEPNFCGAIFVKVSRGICIEPFLGPRTCCFHEVSYATVAVEETRRQVPRESSEERTSVACSVLFIDDGTFTIPTRA